MMPSRRWRRPRACSCSTTRRRASVRATRAAASAPSALPPRPAFSLPSRSAATATAARSSPMSDALAETLRSIRVHGQGSDKYDNVRLGLTGRLDTVQAAILLEKLKIFDDEIAARNVVAERYARGLGNVVSVPRLASGCTSIWAQYTIRLPARLRPRRFRRRAQGAGHSDRDLLCEVDASADRLSGFPGRRRRLAGVRTAFGRCHQPADACLSRRADAGTDHPGCARRAFNLISPFCSAAACCRSG